MTATDYERGVLRTARAWWEMCRPVGWTLEQHLEHPAVNAGGGSANDLARAVAALVEDEQ